MFFYFEVTHWNGLGFKELRVNFWYSAKKKKKGKFFMNVCEDEAKKNLFGDLSWF